MKIRYVSVFLRDETPRLDGAKGVTASSTTLFDTTKMKDLWIELDTASGICTLSQRGNVWNIPRESVQRFGPTLEEYAAYQKSVAETAENTRRANERAAVEAAEIAARPA